MSWAQVAARIRAGVLKGADEAALRMELEAARLAPKGTSESGLDKSLTSGAREGGGRVVAFCRCDAPHGRYIEEGTGPAAGHAKYMPPPGALRQWVSRKFGIHDPEAVAEVERAVRWKIYMKGTEAQPFMRPAFRKVSREWRGILARRISEAIRG